MKFVLASNNRKKLTEMKEILSGLGIDVISLAEAGITDAPEETGVTFAENALIKADAACKATGMPSVADDSGLVVDALGGAPGVYSARYGGEGLNDEERYLLLLKNMEDKERLQSLYDSGSISSSDLKFGRKIPFGKYKDTVNGFDNVFKSFSISNLLSHRLIFCLCRPSLLQKNTMSLR